MKLIWCPETASKSYIDTVRSCKIVQGSSVAELISAMAGGWKPQLIVETWCHGGVISTSIGLSVASRHTSGRHVCIVPDERSRLEYSEAMQSVEGIAVPEIIVGEAEEVMNGLVGVDFIVVDCRRKDFAKILRSAKLSHRGAVLICKNVNKRSTNLGFRWRSVLNCGARVVRTVYLPVGKGLDIAHVAITNGGNNLNLSKAITSRWIRHIDQKSGEEHVFRR
ncbi:Protein of unknown function DUF1442 [Macleaya cordata]|uniref:O-methyltransferase n=1 Tax=Macleaya cordata TaxID=56857 RepID=A0A200QB19_MACCD|nr:Protein of unknown function DUF1442 [Macleaya cordata]